MPTRDLQLRIVKRSPIPPTGPLVFSVMRNEDYFLPFFFDHYRRLGVVGFYIYDDNSDAPAWDWLQSQPDCVLMRSEFAFGDAFGRGAQGEPLRLPTLLRMNVPDRLLGGRWVLTVDADEFFILPPGVADLPSLIARLEREGLPYLTAPMVDFYAETLAMRRYPRHLSPFEANPYFDEGPYYDWSGGLFAVDRIAGVRARLLARLRERRPELARSIYAGTPAKLWKAPLMKHGAGVRRISDHELSVVPRTDTVAALAHFKFYPDLDAKIEHALATRQYYAGSQEYAFLKAAIDLMGEESLIAPRSRRFDGVASLERAHLIHAPAHWRAAQHA